MTVREFLSDQLGQLLLHLVSMAALTFFLLWTGTAGGVMTLVLIIWALGLFLIQSARYLKTCAHLRRLEGIMEGLDQKHLFAECVPKPKGAYERKIFELIRRSGKAMIEAVSDAQATQGEYREYIESWVHEVKAPITAARLICQSAEPETRRKLLRELSQIDNHVERALFYARAESAEKDFIVGQFCLADIAAQAIERHRALLIQSGVRIETEGLDCTVYTDGKWIAFMLGQLLQNSVRYRQEQPLVTLSACRLGKVVRLTVSDNGIGIPAHELPRIFERGFTGSNGRTRGGSTGMGLYLCRKLAGYLEIDLSAASAEGEGTSVTITFPAKEYLSKM